MSTRIRKITARHVRGERVRVLYLMEGLLLGGAERRFVAMARELDRTRFDLMIGTLLPGGALTEEVRKLGIPIARFIRHGRFDPSPALQLARFLRTERIDVVHAMHWLSNAFAELAALWLPDVAVVGSTVGMYYDVAWGARYRLALDHMLWRRMDVMAVNAKELATYLVQRGFPAARLAVVPNGVSIPTEDVLLPAARAAARSRLHLAPDARVVGMVARLDAIKDHRTLLLAARLARHRVPSIQIVVVGDGKERASLEALASDLQIADSVVFAGEITHAESVLPAFDVFVLCSRSEGLPNALLEAGAWGRPSVATAVGGIPEIVIDQRTGLLVPPGDPAALADRVCALLEKPEQARQMGLAAREHVAARFSVRAMVARYQEVYAQAIAARRGQVS